MDHKIHKEFGGLSICVGDYFCQGRAKESYVVEGNLPIQGI